MTQKAYAKVNVFLKIVGTRGDYHLLASRFVTLPDLYDTLRFVPKEKPDPHFILKGKFGCKTEQNSIYKAYRLLSDHTRNKKIEDFFHTHEVIVTKQIPEFAGLGGGSSDAAAFLRLCNRVLALQISTATLASIGAQIGADVPFFIYGYPSANVTGIGEIVTPFEEEVVKLKTFTPPVKCDTAAVYRQFRKNISNQDLTENENLAKTLLHEKSVEILKRYEPETLNDLYPAALTLYPQLQAYAAPNRFFSGSGSTFFTTRED